MNPFFVRLLFGSALETLRVDKGCKISLSLSKCKWMGEHRDPTSCAVLCHCTAELLKGKEALSFSMLNDLKLSEERRERGAPWRLIKCDFWRQFWKEYG